MPNDRAAGLLKTLLRNHVDEIDQEVEAYQPSDIGVSRLQKSGEMDLLFCFNPTDRI
jgi:hypothetical protein